jgi:hypothetical protein
MRHGKIKIVGGRTNQAQLTGQDVAVVMELPDGEEVFIPALSLVLRIGSRHEKVVATVEVPAILVDLHGVELRTEAVVVPGGPESQWEDALGRGTPSPDAKFGYSGGMRIANADEYTEPHIVAGAPMSTGELDAIASSARFVEKLTQDPAVFIRPGFWPKADVADDFGNGLAPVAETDPMAELDRVIADGGSVVNVLPQGPESAFEAGQIKPFDPAQRFTGPVKGHP